MIAPLTLGRECKHLGARIPDGAEHTAVLARERVRREPLGEIVGEKATYVPLSTQQSSHYVTKVPIAEGQHG